MYQTFIFYLLDGQPIFAPPRPPWGKNRSPNLPLSFLGIVRVYVPSQGSKWWGGWGFNPPVPLFIPLWPPNPLVPAVLMTLPVHFSQFEPCAKLGWATDSGVVAHSKLAHTHTHTHAHKHTNTQLFWYRVYIVRLCVVIGIFVDTWYTRSSLLTKPGICRINIDRQSLYLTKVMYTNKI